jgi:hypothetical protein
VNGPPECRPGGGRGVVRRKGGRPAGLVSRSEIGNQVTETAIGVAECLGNFGERPLLDADGSNGFVLPVENLGGMQEEVLVRDVVHGVISEIVT